MNCATKKENLATNRRILLSCISQTKSIKIITLDGNFTIQSRNFETINKTERKVNITNFFGLKNSISNQGLHHLHRRYHLIPCRSLDHQVRRVHLYFHLLEQQQYQKSTEEHLLKLQYV